MKSKQNKIRIYFLGSGKIAVPIIKKIAKSKLIDLVGIGTQPDQPSGRKKKLQPTPIGSWADESGLTVDKPESVNDTEFLRKVEELSPDFILVVSYGQLLKEKILSLPKHGCINVHASLLPKYRGASPIVASILNGDKRTGITIMEMEKGLDSGPIFSSFDYKLDGTENAAKLELDLGVLAAKNIVDVLAKIYAGELLPQPQNHSIATYAGKVKKKDGEIDWTFPAEKIEKMLRAYYPWPGAYFYLNIGDQKKKIQITEAVVCKNESMPESINVGQIIKDIKKMIITCGTDALEIKRLIPEGKKEMIGSDFLLGYRDKISSA